MAYEIPYDSNYGEWYGTPQDVTRLSAMLEQSLDEDGYPIGIITASWNMPDNGGTFVAQLSTDGTDYHIAETNIRQNSVILVVEPNTDYYLKIITVLGSQQSSGVVSSLLSSSVTIVPPTPTVVAVQGGMQINVGSVPFGYNAVISISDGTDTTVLYTTNMITIYNCDAGTYTVSTAYSNASNDMGASSSSVSVTVSELATADDYVEKTSADYIKSASVNQAGDTLTLTKGDDSTVTFQGGGGGYVLPIASSSTLGGIKVGNNLSIDENGVLSASGGGGGGGASYTETVLFSNSSGVTSGTINLSGNISDYDLVIIDRISVGSVLEMYTSTVLCSDLMLANSSSNTIVLAGYGNQYTQIYYSSDTSIVVSYVNNEKVAKIIGIKFGGGGSGGGSYTAGDGIDITNDTISLETASTTDIGGVKVGSGLSIDGNGVLSATGGGGGSPQIAIPDTSISSVVIDKVAGWITSGSTVYSYTAVGNCFVGGMVGSASTRSSLSTTTGVGIYINNNYVANAEYTVDGTSSAFPILYPLSAGDTISFKRNSGSMKLYIKVFATKSITSPTQMSMALPNFSNKLSTIADATSSWITTDVSYSYTATENCVVIGMIGSRATGTPNNTAGVEIDINGNYLYNGVCSLSSGSDGVGFPIYIPLAQGDTITARRRSGGAKFFLEAYALR